MQHNNRGSLIHPIGGVHGARSKKDLVRYRSEQRWEVEREVLAEGTERRKGIHPKLSPTYCLKLFTGKATLISTSGGQ